MLKPPPTLSVYIHWPFCLAKCPYCDFNSHVRESIDATAWESALLKELDFYLDKTGKREITTVFFGGGTPSLMPPETVEKILGRLNLVSDVEITLEANPTSVEAAKLAAFRGAGVNRISLGVQSLNNESLNFLGRKHSAKEALKAVELAAKVFPRYSIDLIYALPLQTTRAWLAELEEAVAYVGDHLSLYQLTIEPNTNFFHLYQAGKFELPSDEIRADMYDATGDFLAAKGFRGYEISNYAKPGGESRHNLTYWRYGDYIGVGPGAHGRFVSKGVRYESLNTKSPEKWIESVTARTHGAEELASITFSTSAAECALMGLRLMEGLCLDSFKAKTGVDFMEIANQEKIGLLSDIGLVQATASRITATPRGFLVLDKITAEILGG